MKNIIINNEKFDFNIGCKLLKLKYDECPTQFENALGDFWNDIVPLTFQEIATDIVNLEQRRIAIDCLGLERLYEQVNPELVSTKSIKKTTTWVNADGKVETINFKDTYELYRVKKEVWGANATSNRWATSQDVCFVKCKDTSTDRSYFIWVNPMEVYRTNDKRENGRWYSRDEDYSTKITPIQAVAWTIQTNIPKECIEKIVRQGDCIMIKKTHNGVQTDSVRHLTEEEYRELLVLES